MKIAIFGGTGFLGYEFVRQLLDSDKIEPVIYSTNPSSLANVSRHDLDIRLIQATQLPDLKLDDTTEFVVNFSHPFGVRQDVSVARQIDLFVKMIQRQRSILPNLRLVHLSTMSVYEPFKQSRVYCESDLVRPPRSDGYARGKAAMERKLKKLPLSDQWQLHLRPTVVYGPFCVPWTDKIMEAFTEGDIAYNNLDGRIQPVHGRDVCRLILRALENFTPGTLNVAGEEKMTWYEFLVFIEHLVKEGKLKQAPGVRPQSFGPSVGLSKFYKDNVRELFSVVAEQESFERLASPILRLLPRKFVVWVRDRFFSGSVIAPKTHGTSSFASTFFSEDRLVSTDRLCREFPGFQFEKLEASSEELKSYYKFRFTDAFLE